MTTLYLTEPRSVVRKEGDCLLVQIPGDPQQGTEKRSVRVPLIKVDQVVVYGDSTLTAPAVLALLEQRADICYCTAHGQFRGRLSPEFSKNALLRIRQHEVHHDYPSRVALAKAFVWGKLANQRTLLLRSNRKLEDEEVAAAAAEIHQAMVQVRELAVKEGEVFDPVAPQHQSTWGALQGLEGTGASAYFRVFGRLLRGDLSFSGRNRRPPRDPVNALLSFGYVLLMNQVMSAINIVGLDPYVGYLHASQYGKPALALDLMEEFRPIVVDSVVLTLVNNRMLGEDDFVEEMGTYRLKDHGRREFLRRFEERLNEEIHHPVFDYRATYRRCIELQVRLLSKMLTGEIGRYEPFTVR